MRTGIIGLAGAGKTTLFRILTGGHAAQSGGKHAAVHVGVAQVPDPRVDRLSELYHPKKITYASMEYLDVAALAGESGRDSAFLVQLREVDALVHVVRAFDDPSNPPPGGKLDPHRDVETLDLDLVLYDLEQVSRRVERIEKDLKKKKDPKQEHELVLLGRCREALEAERALREVEFSAEEEKVLTGFQFLSRRPMIYALNVNDGEAGDLAGAAGRHGLETLGTKPGTALVALCGKVEAELAELPEAEAAELMQAYGLTEPGRDRLIRTTYELLGWISFLTAGEPECRAWTIRRGMSAAEAAGAIHSDIQRGFIKAEVVDWQDLLAAGSWAAAREAGKLRLEGREYVVQDGDVILFRHSG
ncbi:MAG TPA: redox-regulated ATPase YchF [Patescibacteria group bacterium]|nr:redox-regulated ATPase YchF [Patescibacteria group bacterium]